MGKSRSFCGLSEIFLEISAPEKYFSDSGKPEIWAKVALSADFQRFSWKFRPLKNIFRTLENGHSIRHQSIPPLSPSRLNSENFEFGWPASHHVMPKITKARDVMSSDLMIMSCFIQTQWLEPLFTWCVAFQGFSARF